MKKTLKLAKVLAKAAGLITIDLGVFATRLTLLTTRYILRVSTVLVEYTKKSVDDWYYTNIHRPKSDRA